MSHTCNNLMIVCMDFRFQQAISDWAISNGMSKDYDLVSLAGAQKSIIDEDTRATVMKQVGLSTELHGATHIYIIAHQDCGAYGGANAFANWEDEKARYVGDMTKASEIINAEYPDVTVHKVLMTFEGDRVEFNEV